MPQKTIKGSEALAQRIKGRRNELGLTIEEAAFRAGVGTKTWCRYEAGESIRQDKCKGICKALNWRDFPEDTLVEDDMFSPEAYQKHKAWSVFLAENYGFGAAAAFAVGSDMLLDYIEQDLADLATMPVGTHIGQLSASFISAELPPQFLMRYDYDFLYCMKCTLILMRERAGANMDMTAHSVMEELILYLCDQEAKCFLEITNGAFDFGEEDDFDWSEDWVFDLLEDMDIVTCLYSDEVLDEEHIYHFSHWNEKLFFVT